MNRRKQLLRLTALAEMQRELELAKLSTLTQRQREIETEVADLEAARRSAHGYSAECPEIAIAAGRFDAFALTRRDQMYVQIAALVPEIDQARAVAARAVGRHSVLQKLSVKK
ncbi:hypothetical protein [Thioclava sp.]|uniref:hypothetical protein n=1 Tax=Thioclava sp. TaxID=1933450 RepID=UPI003AA91A84